jgi:hypothetical protein
VRDFVYDEKQIEAGKKEAEDVDTKIKKQFVSTFPHCGGTWWPSGSRHV